MENIRRLSGNLAIGLVVLLACAIRAQANGIIHDPAMGVERGDFSTALFQGVNMVPTGGGGGIFGFYNATSQNITELMFEVNIALNLDPTLVQDSFACNEGNTNPFFMNCSVQYVPDSGLLGIAFWGTNPAVPVGTATPTDEVGLHMGIPPLLAGCLSDPDATGCTDVGHFAITLNDNFSLSGTDGGWNNTNSPGLFNDSVLFTANSVSTTFGAEPTNLPEPATFAMLGGALIGLGLLAKRRRMGPSAR